MNLVIGSVFLVVLLNALMVLRERRLLRLSKARLEIVLTVTEMEAFLLKGKVKCGDLLHDKFFQRMLAWEYATGYRVSWKFWRVNPEVKELREKLNAEFVKRSELGKLLWRYSKAQFRVFENRHPFQSRFFVVWLLICAGGLVVLLGGLAGYLGFLHLRKTINDGVENFKRLLASSYTSYGLSAQPA